MKNLKRVLSLGLASVMLLGMMVMGASAATFSDAADIKNTEAVNMMTALNVINGKDTGAFDPNGLVTRAEMAKMITMILFGGEEPALAAGSTSKFSDVALNHWARKYIEYCAGENLGIIAGLGDGTFAPDANITGTQAAKMALVALGYNPTVYGFENNKDWEININYRANTKEANLYNGLKNLNPSAQITRDQAAQILYNALKAQVVAPQYTITSNGVETQYTITEDTLLETRFEVEIFTGTITKVTYNEEHKVFVNDFKDLENNEQGGLTASSVEDTYAENLSNLILRKVEVITDGDGKILGIGASKDSAVLSSGTWGDVKFTLNDAKDAVTKIDGAAYTSGTTKFYLSTDAATEKALTVSDEKATVADAKAFYSYAVINNEAGKDAQVVILYPVTVEKVSFVGKSSITTQAVAGSNGGSYNLEDCDVYSDVKKGDYVVVTAGIEGETSDDADSFIVEKAEIVTGEITATKNDDKQIRVDGTWYKLENGLAYGTDVARGSEYDLVIVNGYAVAAEKVSEAASTDVAYVVARNEITGTDSIEKGAQTVRLMFADGTTKTITVDRIWDADGGDDSQGAFVKVDEANQAELDTLYFYTVTSAGNYRLTAVADKHPDYEESVASVTEIKDGRVNSTNRIANDGIFFVKNGDGDVSALTGAQVAAWKAINSTQSAGSDIIAADSFMYGNKASNGFITMSLGVITLDGKIPGQTGKSTDAYGVLTAAPITVTEDGTTYRELTIWTAEGEVEVKVESTDVTGTLANKAVVKFDDLGNGYAENMSVLTTVNGAVTGYDGDEDIVIATEDNKSGVAAKITKDTAIVYFNTKTNKGAEGGEIILATETAENKLAYNVKFIVEDNDDGGKDVVMIIVDTNNQLYTDSDTKVDDLVLSAPHQHTWDNGTVKTAATCTANEVKTYTCTGDGCNATKEEETANSALGHNYDGQSWQGGDTGTHTLSCSRSCGEGDLTHTATFTGNTGTCTESTDGHACDIVHT